MSISGVMARLASGSIALVMVIALSGTASIMISMIVTGLRRLAAGTITLVMIVALSGSSSVMISLIVTGLGWLAAGTSTLVVIIALSGSSSVITGARRLLLMGGRSGLIATALILAAACFNHRNAHSST